MCELSERVSGGGEVRVRATHRQVTLTLTRQLTYCTSSLLAQTGSTFYLPSVLGNASAPPQVGALAAGSPSRNLALLLFPHAHTAHAWCLCQLQWSGELSRLQYP